MGRNRVLNADAPPKPASHFMTLVHSPLVFVCGHRKSGTSLLANLLDGHPELSVYPNDLALLYAYFPDFIASHTDSGERRARLRQVLFTDLTERLERFDPPLTLDVGKMVEVFFASLPDAKLADMGTLIARLMAAYQDISGQSAGKKVWGVVKETSIEIYAAEILEWFPEARFIQVLRDPRDNFAALAAGVKSYYEPMGEDRNSTLASLLHRARLGLRMARLNVVAFGPERYHLLRFENLVNSPETAMKSVTEFLGIAQDPALAAPTVLGASTMGNSFDGEAMCTVRASNAGRWRDRITESEAQTIEFHMAEEMEAFGYAPVFSPVEQSRAAAEYYKWQNYAYFYRDRFGKTEGS